MSAIPNTGSLRQLVRNVVKEARQPELRHADLLPEAVAAVQPIPGEASRVFVASRSRDVPHLVDVDEYSGTGQCKCEDFTCNHEPYLSGKRAAEGYSPRRRCWHIVVAIEYLHLQEVRKRSGA